MQFVVEYVRLGSLGDKYFRTITANDLTEAVKLAKRYERKGFIYITLKERF